MKIRLIRSDDAVERLAFEYGGAEPRVAEKVYQENLKRPAAGSRWEIVLCEACRREGLTVLGSLTDCWDINSRLGINDLKGHARIDELHFGQFQNCNTRCQNDDLLNPDIRDFDARSVTQADCDNLLNAEVITDGDMRIRYPLFANLTAELFRREQSCKTSTDPASDRSLMERLIWGDQPLRSAFDYYAVYAFLNLDAFGGYFVIKQLPHEGKIEMSWSPGEGLSDGANKIAELWCSRLGIALCHSKWTPGPARLREQELTTLGRLQGLSQDDLASGYESLPGANSVIGQWTQQAIQDGCPVPNVLKNWQNFASGSKNLAFRKLFNELIKRCVLKSEIMVNVPQFRFQLKEYPSIEPYPGNDELDRRLKCFESVFGGCQLHVMSDPIDGHFRFLESLIHHIKERRRPDTGSSWVRIPYDDIWLRKWYTSLFANSHPTRVGFDAEIDGPFYVGYSRVGDPVGQFASGDRSDEARRSGHKPRQYFTDRKWGWVTF